VHPVSQFQQRLWRVAVLGLIFTILLVLPGGRDMFRAPKDAAFRAVGILLMGIAAYGFLVGDVRSKLNWRDPATVISAAILFWVTIATVGSTNFIYSVETLVTVICGIAFFGVVVSTARFHRIGAIAFIALPALINVGLVLLQESKIWNPFRLHSIIFTNPHLATTGLLGNPNDVGMLLAISTLAAVAAAVVMYGQERLVWSVVAAGLFLGLLVSQTMTALVALCAALATMYARKSPRRAAIMAVPVLIAVTLAVLAYQPMRYRVGAMIYRAKQGNYDLLLTRRLGAFLAASEMTSEHPVKGVGPGTFGWHYFDYKLRVDQEYPGMVFKPKFARDWTYNFAEVHNDHLEILAETGIPGYLLFLAALFILAAGSFVKRDLTSHTFTRRRKLRYDFGRVISLPLAVLIFLLSLGQFPLQLAATTMAILFLGAIAYSWSRHELV
jgi:O-antigen ligase